MARDEKPPETNLSQESGCAVDWSWLQGLTIASITSDLRHWRVQFTNGQTFTVEAAEYQGKPFLAFRPYKAPIGP